MTNEQDLRRLLTYLIEGNASTAGIRDALGFDEDKTYALLEEAERRGLIERSRGTS